jgi:replicative DNA helicase
LATTDYSLERGLPANIDAERSILGAILLDNFTYTQASSENLQADDFSLDSHRRIYGRIAELADSGRPVDLVTLAEELSRRKEVEAIGGVAYLSSLTDGLPHRPNIEQYVRIVKDKALLRGLIYASNAAVARAMDDPQSATEMLTAAEADLYQLSDKKFGSGFRGITQIVKESFGSIDALLEHGQITGLQTHFQRFDEMTRGLQRSDLVIIAGRPSMGKTAFALNIAESASVNDGKVVGVFSLEMSREALLLRMLCSNAQVDSHRLSTGFDTREDRVKLVAALGRLSEAPIFIDDTPGITISEMRAKARRLQHQMGGRLDLLIVDYLQLMSGSSPGAKARYENRTQEVSAISRGLKLLAKELRVPVIGLSQLSRTPESRSGDHRPQLADLRESGSIEQDADVVAFIFREEVYMTRDDAKAKGVEGVAELIIGKQRNGPIGAIKLTFRGKYTRFDNPADEPEPEY